MAHTKYPSMRTAVAGAAGFGKYVLKRAFSGTSGGKRKKIKGGMKRKRGRSWTKTKKTKSGKLSFSDAHAGISSKNVTIQLHKPIQFKGLGRLEYWRNRQYVLTCGAGIQVVKTLAVLNSITQWTTGTAYPQVNDSTKNALFDLNPAEKTAGSFLYPTGTVPLNDRLVCLNTNWQGMIYNNSSASIKVELYVYVAKKTTSLYPDAMMNSGAVKDALGMSLLSFPGAPPSATSSGYPDNTAWPVKPTDIPILRSFYRLEKVISMQMAADSSEEVKVNVRVNKLMKRDVISTLNGAVIPGGSVCIVARAYGQPIHDKSGAVDNTTLSPVNVNIVDNIKWTLCSLKDGSATRLNTEFVDYNNLPIGGVVGSLAQVSNTDTAITFTTG